MKRDQALAELSRDHHQALFAAMKMKRVSGDGLAGVRDDVLAFWREHGAKHFRIEEDILLPAFAREADPAQEAVVTVLVDHVWIRERMERLANGELESEQVRELGTRLDAHVRHEERVLFPLIEQSLSDEALSTLGERLAHAEAT